MLAQATHRANRNNPLNAQTLERPDIGAHRNFGGQDAMPAPVTRQKSHRHTLYVANHNHVARPAKGRLYLNLLHIGHTLHLVKSAAADHANFRLWHGNILLPTVEKEAQASRKGMASSALTYVMVSPQASRKGWPHQR